MNKLNNKKGISLIVLVITIIVMIILAAAIILSLQSSGIIGRANEAKAKSDETNMLQAANIAYSEYMLEKDLVGTNKTAEVYVKEKLAGDFEQEAISRLNVLSDGTIQILPTIPTGFTPSIYEGEQKISDGLVVYEALESELVSKSKEEAMTMYNQYVWIPVEGEFERKNWQKIENFEDTYKEPYNQGYDDEIEEYNSMRTSVEKNGGFYIARYEAGLPNERTIATVLESDMPVSKKGANIWHASWGTSMTNIGTTGAVAVAKRLYPKNGESNIVSTLCYGVQWDSAMNFMKNMPNVSDSSKKYVNDSTGMGWYGDKSNYEVKKTGIDIEKDGKILNMVKNIYDMAGNVCEWTMEAHASNNWRVVRGDSYISLNIIASRRSERIFAQGGDDSGFRVALYIK